MDPADVKVIAVSGNGTLFLIDAGEGDKLGQVEPLARIFNLVTQRYETEPWPVAALTGRGYWDDLSGIDAITLDSVRETAAAAA